MPRCMWLWIILHTHEALTLFCLVPVQPCDFMQAEFCVDSLLKPHRSKVSLFQPRPSRAAKEDLLLAWFAWSRALVRD